MRYPIKSVLVTGAAAALMSLGAMAQQAPSGDSAADLKARFAELDKDGDGRISRSELGGDTALQQTFDRIDLERDGYVTRSELFAAESEKSRSM